MFDTIFDPIAFGVNLIDAQALACSCGCCGGPTACGGGQGAGMDEPIIVCPGS